MPRRPAEPGGRAGWAGVSIVALAGGVGGSRFARGLRAAAPGAHLTVVVNTGDDLTLHGLRISPDVDTMLYALAGIVDEARGWGPRGDSYRCLAALERLGGETWFQLGDLDLATHLHRTGLLASGRTSSGITAELARCLGITGTVILPMSDDPVETWVQLAEDGRWVHFQEYFVGRRAEVPIRKVRFQGLEAARPAPGVLEALAAADLVVLCPSNPFVSLAPILGVPGVRTAVRSARNRGAVVAGVSPLIGGGTVKGPAARMLAELGHEPTAAGVAAQYADLLDAFLIDPIDAALGQAVQAQGARPIVADALMRGRRGEARLARVLLRATLGQPARA
ncbi:MAG: 2-phospho-L-lactate transferase [Chloroflexi bacterium]|nr:2-phospho-L-lactate transferase [Chloroflexota bacterium]